MIFLKLRLGISVGLLVTVLLVPSFGIIFFSNTRSLMSDALMLQY